MQETWCIHHVCNVTVLLCILHHLYPPGPVSHSELQRPGPSRNWYKYSWGPALDYWTPGATGGWPSWTLHAEFSPWGAENFWRWNLCWCQLQECLGHATLQCSGTCERGTRSLLAQQGCGPLLCPVRCDRPIGGRRGNRGSGVAHWMLTSSGGQWEAAVAPGAVEATRRTCPQVWAAQESRGWRTKRQGQGYHHCWWGNKKSRCHKHLQTVRYTHRQTSTAAALIPFLSLHVKLSRKTQLVSSSAASMCVCVDAE